MNKRSIGLVLLVNALSALIGLVLIFNPIVGIDFVRIFMGIALILSGFTGLYIFFAKLNTHPWGKLVQGILSVFAGSMLLSNIVFSFIALSLILMIWAFSDGFVKIAIGISYKKMGVKTWWLPTLLGLFSYLFGFYVLFNSAISLLTLTMVIGLFSVYGAIAATIQALAHQDDEIAD